MGPNLYQTLGVDTNAKLQEIKSAYRTLAKFYHPDVSTAANAGQKFIAITEAYEILSNPVKRKNYNFTLQNRSTLNSSRGNSKGRYARSTQRARQQARKKANEYKDMDYKRFESEYFKSFSAYFFPKFFGCLGFGMIGIVFLFIVLVVIVKYELPINYLAIAIAIVFFASAYAGANLSLWHDAREKKRYKKRTAGRNNN